MNLLVHEGVEGDRAGLGRADLWQVALRGRATLCAAMAALRPRRGAAGPHDLVDPLRCGLRGAHGCVGSSAAHVAAGRAEQPDRAADRDERREGVDVGVAAERRDGGACVALRGTVRCAGSVGSSRAATSLTWAVCERTKSWECIGSVVAIALGRSLFISSDLDKCERGREKVWKG